jgi:hypothetical protein
MEASGAQLSPTRMTTGTKSTAAPTATNEYPSAISVAANIGTCNGDQFVRRKVYVSNSRDRPATTNAYPTHLLGGIAMLDLDSTADGRVPKTFGQEYESHQRNCAQLSQDRLLH